MPKNLFSVEMLPADHGDCLIITYGSPDAPHRVLIDGGTAATFPRLQQHILSLPKDQRHFELLIVTHIDSDHIDGVLGLLRAKLDVTFRDIWFNGWKHLVPPTSEFLGPRQGDMLGNLLSMRTDLPWNEDFGGERVYVPSSGALPVRVLPGGLKLTLLSPTMKELTALDTAWIKESFQQGRFPGEAPPALGRGHSRVQQLAETVFVRDRSAANGSSIAVLAEFQGRRCLLGADAFADTLLASLKRLPGAQGRLGLDAFKLPHHGSAANVSSELIQAVECQRYLISTDGSVFDHPDDEAIARLLHPAGGGIELYFNYDTPRTRAWEQLMRPGQRDELARGFYPSGAEGGLKVDIPREESSVRTPDLSPASGAAPQASKPRNPPRRRRK